MSPSMEAQLARLLKKLVFRPAAKHPRLQGLWSRLHTVAIFGMNYGGGGLPESSGEEWVLAHVVREACRHAERPVVFDVGANVGDYSRLVRRWLPSALIYALEPSRPVHAELARNVAGWGDGAGIKTFNVGLSDADTTVELHSYTVEGNAVSLLSTLETRRPTQALRVEPVGTERVTVRTLDRFCGEQGVGRIDLLKLDVEGHELAVLRGARRLLAEGAIAMIQFELSPSNIYSRTYFYDFWDLLSPAFDFYRIIPHGMVHIGAYGEHREIFLATNYLAVRRPGAR